MKTSNILLTVAISLFVLVTLCSNLILKNQFDKIDKDDEFYGFARHPVPAFRHVRLQGKNFALTEIQQGSKPEIRMLTLAKFLEWKMSGDTLVVNYKPDWNPGYQPRASFGSLPSIYIIAPKLEGIFANNIRCAVRDYQFDNLVVEQKGDGLLFENSSAKKLTATIYDYGYLQLKPDNHFGSTDIDVRDSSTFHAEKDVFTDLKAKIDSSAFINMPGSMLRKMMAGNKITPR